MIFPSSFICLYCNFMRKRYFLLAENKYLAYNPLTKLSFDTHIMGMHTKITDTPSVSSVI